MSDFDSKTNKILEIQNGETHFFPISDAHPKMLKSLKWNLLHGILCFHSSKINVNGRISV